jgi:hypothetical protein
MRRVWPSQGRASAGIFAYPAPRLQRGCAASQYVDLITGGNERTMNFKGVLGEPTIWPNSALMALIPTARIGLPLLALTAACGAAVVSVILHETQPSVETRSATTGAAVAPTADVRDGVSAALAKALPPTVSPVLPDGGDAIMPAFEFVLVGRAGDAVIAGTAAPGAAVELSRNAEPLDTAIADQFGQFVMTPSRLPSGDYELTLRSRQGNGKQATSRRSVAVTVQPSPTDQNIAPMTSDKASVVPAKPLVSSTVRHSSRTRREATGPAARDLGGRPELFNHVIGSHQ